MHIKVKSIIITILFLFVAYNPAHATIYFYFDAENGTDGANLPNPPICQTECSGSGAKATYQSNGGAPEGSKYFQWQTVDNQTNHYTEIHPSPEFPINNVLGKTYYLAYFFNFSRINGLDIWHETGQSGDKGVELIGAGLRWAVGGGHWPSHADNQDHRYTMMGGNATYHLNPELEVQDGYVQNQSGYNGNNPLQLQYEQWYSAVMAVKMATDNTGSFTVYIDGVKVYEYNNIKTVATTSATITDIWAGGTIAQGAYDAPAHLRKFDALMLTDNWQDIINGGYLGSGGGDTQAPSIPSNLSAQTVSTTQINLSWTASTDDTGVTGYRIYRDGAQIDTSATNFYSNIGLSASTTYTYSVSAYDAVGNNSAQTSNVSATTQAQAGDGGDTGGNTSGSGGDSASGGSGCGFVKDSNDKGQGAKGEGVALIVMLIILLAGIALVRRISEY